MRIVVCVKAVPHPSSPRRIDPDTLRLDRGDELVANAPDLHAVEEALRLRETGSREGLEVVLACMGPRGSFGALRTPLAMGADRAVLVCDEALAGSDLVATSWALAATIVRERPDLVLFGQQSSDGNGAVLFAAVANRLRLPLLSRAVSLEIRDGRVRARRRDEAGVNTIEAPLPCVVAVSSAINDPRVPTFRQLKAAGAKPCDTLTLDDLGLAAADVAACRTKVLRLGQPATRVGAERIVDQGDAPERILDYLVARNLLG